MNLSADLSLRDATLQDLPAIVALREAVGWGVQPWALRAVIGHADARCVLAMTPRGDVAGVGSGIVYGPMGFVGNMIVAAGYRRRGIGSTILAAVMRFLEAAGCVRLELNATADGRPLYERHGFHSVGTSLVASVPRTATLTPLPAVTVRHAAADDLEAIVAYDVPRFGGDRRRILATLLSDSDRAFLLAERDRQLAGFGSLEPHDGRMGPLVADEPAVAATLLAAGFARASDAAELRVNLPPGNRNGAAWLRSLGVTLDAWDGRMARGAELPKRDETIYGMAVGALG
jgi:ribosomal protein S18 acetylase RimI-like enzyme